MGQFDTFVAVQVTDEGERDYEFPECLLHYIICHYYYEIGNKLSYPILSYPEIRDWNPDWELGWELGCLGSIHLTCYVARFFCRNVWQIKDLEPRWGWWHSIPAERLWARDFGGCHCPGDSSDPGDWAVRLCGWPSEMLWLAGPDVAVGVAILSSNERAQAVVICPGVVRIEYNSAAATGGWAGITFDVDLVVPWDAPEAVVDLHSDGVVELDMVPDVLGLIGRRPVAAVVRRTGTRRVECACLDSGSRGAGAGFSWCDHRRYGGLTRTVGVYGRVVSSPPTMAGNGAPKYCVATAGPGDCSYCGKWIKCDMYRHVATYHLELWRCPVSWCTVWKGMPQDCMDHVRGCMMCHGTSSLQVLSSLSHRGWFSVKFGWILSSPVIRGSLLTYYCSARSIYRWFIIIVFTSVGYHISLSGRIILLVCESLCHRRRPCLSVIWCPRFSPVQFRCALLAPLSMNLSRRGRPDVTVARCGPYEYLRNKSVSNLRLWPSRMRHIWQVPWSMTVDLRFCLCPCGSRILACCLCADQLLQPAWLRLPRRTPWWSVVRWSWNWFGGRICHTWGLHVDR